MTGGRRVLRLREAGDEIAKALAVGADAVMVGDRPSTDGGFAATLGCRFALVRSGVTPTGVLPTDEPSWFVGTTLDIDVPNLAGVADFLLK